MSKKMFFYLALVFVTTNLFYNERWGLNTLIIAFLTIVVSLVSNRDETIPKEPKTGKWWFAAFLFVLNGFAVFYNHSLLSSVFYILSFLYFSAVHNERQLSVPLGFAQSIQSFFGGFYYFVESMITGLKQKEKKDTQNLFIRFLLFTVPVIIAIVFLKLYQTADQTFYEMTKFINLDWISWGFIGFYFVIFVSSYGLFFYNTNAEINKLEANLKNGIANDYDDGVQKYLGLKNEKKIALSLLITLNVMLLLYNFIDLKFILIDLPNPEPTLRYSALLHGGVNSLITSIILVIIIITFLYRGQLNFQGNKITRALALVWLFLNLLMVFTTAVKNAEYIAHWGLTYKRIGVYIYLLLATMGLVFTIIKIIRIKSIWFLIRNTSLAFLTCFTFMGLVNWDKLIVKHNLTQLEPNQIDFEYLISIGWEAYPDLMHYYNAHKESPEITEDRWLWHHLFESFEDTRKHLREKRSTVTWRSLNLREAQLLKRMENFKLVYKRNEYTSL